MKAPIWCERNTNPNSMPTWRVPNISATSPEVSGTVESHSRPIMIEKTITMNGVVGTIRNSENATAREK